MQPTNIRMLAWSRMFAFAKNQNLRQYHFKSMSSLSTSRKKHGMRTKCYFPHGTGKKSRDKVNFDLNIIVTGCGELSIYLSFDPFKYISSFFFLHYTSLLDYRRWRKFIHSPIALSLSPSPATLAHHPRIFHRASGRKSKNYGHRHFLVLYRMPDIEKRSNRRHQIRSE